MKNESQAMPKCLVSQDTDGLLITFDLDRTHSTSLKTLLSEDRKRLYAVAESTEAGETNQFLWSFSIPKKVNHAAISTHQAGKHFFIHLPKLNETTYAHESQYSYHAS
jgi:hypothetical protein